MRVLGVQRTDVDGVPTFWVDTGRPTLGGVLVFRQGMVDESLTTSGWTHLLEHLALEDRGGGALHVNGSVTGTITTFDAHGPVDAVVAHLVEVCAWLASPRLDRVDHEAGVLRAESGVRGGSATARALGWRYGVRGLGLAAYDEPGLGRASAAGLAALAAERFHRGNAALVLDGPPPTGLRLPLPDGQGVHPVPAAVPLGDTLPAGYVEEAGLVLSGVVSRDGAGHLAGQLLEQELRRLLRSERAGAYAPWWSYEHADRDRAVLLAGSDVQPALLPTLAGTVTAMLEELATAGPDADALREVVEGREQALRDPYQAAGLAARAAVEHLQGRPVLPPEEHLEQLRRTTPADVAAAVEELRRTLLLGVPGETAWDDAVPMLRPTRSAPVKAGTGFRSVDWPADLSRLRIDEHLVQLVDPRAGDALVIDVRRAAGLFRFEDGLRHVVQEDGYGITVDPRRWRGGDRAVAALDRVVPETVHLPHPAADRPPVERMSLVRRWGHGVGAGLSLLLVSRVAVTAMLIAAWVGCLALSQVLTGTVLWGALVGIGGLFTLNAALPDPD